MKDLQLWRFSVLFENLFCVKTNPEGVIRLSKFERSGVRWLVRLESRFNARMVWESWA